MDVTNGLLVLIRTSGKAPKPAVGQGGRTLGSPSELHWGSGDDFAALTCFN